MLLSAMLVKSENDAAAALARDCFGNLATFAAAMNTTAWDLGAHDSHFVNPHGLPAYQYSTARDMARIAFRAYTGAIPAPARRQPLFRFRICHGQKQGPGKHQQVAQTLVDLQWNEDRLHECCRTMLRFRARRWEAAK